VISSVIGASSAAVAPLAIAASTAACIRAAKPLIRAVAEFITPTVSVTVVARSARTGAGIVHFSFFEFSIACLRLSDEVFKSLFNFDINSKSTTSPLTI
jgi:hypothetical protein